MNYVVTLLAAGLIVIGDVLLKEASVKWEEHLYYIFAAAFLYALSAPAWAYVMQGRSLVWVGIMFTTLTVVGLFLVSWLWFSEPPTKWQLVALPLAIAAAVMSEF